MKTHTQDCPQPIFRPWVPVMFTCGDIDIDIYAHLKKKLFKAMNGKSVSLICVTMIS